MWRQTFLWFLASGCIVPHPYGDPPPPEPGHPGGCGGCGGGAGGEDPPEPPAPLLFLDPDALLAGDTAIGSLTSDQALDWALVDDVHFERGVAVTAFEPRTGELLLSLTVGGEAAAGLIDLVVDFVDGASVQGDDVFEILGPCPGADPEDTGSVEDSGEEPCG